MGEITNKITHIDKKVFAYKDIVNNIVQNDLECYKADIDANEKIAEKLMDNNVELHKINADFFGKCIEEAQTEEEREKIINNYFERIKMNDGIIEKISTDYYQYNDNESNKRRNFLAQIIIVAGTAYGFYKVGKPIISTMQKVLTKA